MRDHAGVVMLVDTREPEPEPKRSSRWRSARPLWRLRWFALVCVLLLWSLATSGWLSVGFVYVALVVSFWRGLRLMPTTGGLSDHKQ